VTDDLLAGRLVAACAHVLGVLDAFDALSIAPSGSAEAEAKASLKLLGPAALGCAVLSASPEARGSSVASGAVDRFVAAAVQRRERILAALPTPQRRAIEAHLQESPMAPARVLDLFGEALAGLGKNEIVQRLGSGGELAAMTETVQAAARGERPSDEAMAMLANRPAESSSAEGAEPTTEGAEQPLPDFREPLPPEALDALGAVLAGSGADAASVARVLAGVGPLQAPEGFVATAAGSLVRDGAKVRRNDPCPCGSGRKYKRCHGRG